MRGVDYDRLYQYTSVARRWRILYSATWAPYNFDWKMIRAYGILKGRAIGNCTRIEMSVPEGQDSETDHNCRGD